MSVSKIHMGSRTSRLAVIQVEELTALIRQIDSDIVLTSETFQSAGDANKSQSLMTNKQDDFWTDVLDAAVISGEIDVAVHSAKDLPMDMHPDLCIYALTRSADETDAFVGKESLGKLPAGSKIGTSSGLRREALKKIRPDCEMLAVRGTIEERIAKVDQGELDGLIVATIALKRLGLQDRIMGILPWDGFPLQGQLAVVGRRDNRDLRHYFEPWDVRRLYGKVTLLGAGPGDPDLLTLKGVKALKQADCVMYDYLVHKAILEHAPQSEKVYVGKRKGDHVLLQQELCRLIRQHAIKGKNIVRLKGGDPLVFGRGADEISYLKQYHIDVDVIPGVSSATGIPASLGIPLTARDYSSSVAFLSAYQANETGGQSSAITVPKDVDTLVYFMGLSKLEDIVTAVKASGRDEDTPIAIVSRGTRYDQSVLRGTLGDILSRVKIDVPQPPALIIIGQTVSLYQENLECETIIYTGTHPEKYQSLGKVIHMPMITIGPAAIDERDSQKLVRDLPDYDLILLTSRFAVRYFVDWIRQNDSAHAVIAQKDIIVIGRDTAQALMDHGLHPRHISGDETSRGVFALLKEKYDLVGKKVLFPRSNLSNPFLKSQLQDSGAQVHELTIYQNAPTEFKPLPEQKVDKIIFTSPSTVASFLKKYERIPDDWRILCKGPVTQKALKDHNYESEIILYG